MYLSAQPFEKLGFISVPNEPTPKLAETIQHSLFSYFVVPHCPVRHAQRRHVVIQGQKKRQFP